MNHTRVPSRLIWLVLTCSTLTVMGGAIMGPVVAEIGAALHVDPSSAGLIITMHGVFVFALSPLAGVLIDRVGARRPLFYGLLLYGVSGGSGLAVNSYAGLLVTRAFLGASIALIYTAITVVILDLYEGGRRNRAMGLRASANSFGAAVWPLLGGALGVLSWHSPFAVYLVGIPLGLLILRYMPDVKRGTGGRGGSMRSILAASPVVLAIYGVMLVTMVLLYANVVYMPQLLRQGGISSTFSIGLFLAAMGLAAAITSSQYHRVRRRLEYHRILPVSFLLWIAAFSTIRATSSFWTYGVGIALFGVGQGLMMPTALLWIADVVPSAFLGRFSSYITTFGFLGQFLSPIAFAPVARSLGVEGVFLAAGVVAVTGLVLSVGGVLLHRNVVRSRAD
jgi:ACDE family multidrug resistance protein